MTRQLSLIVLVSVIAASFFVTRISEREALRTEVSAPAEAIVSIRDMRTDERRHELRAEGLLIRYYGDVSQIRPGDRIKVTGKYTAIRELPSERFSQGYIDYLKSEGIAYLVEAKKLEPVEKHFDAYTLRYELRSRLGKTIDAMYPQRSPVIKALIYGDRSTMPEETEEAFVRSGTLHILALSGFHVGIIAGLLNFLLAKIPVKKRGLIVCLLLIAYAFFTGLGASILRACLFFVLYYLSFLRAERYNLFSASCMTAALLLALNPYELYSRGFVLSFAAVISIALFYPMLTDYGKKLAFSEHTIFKALLLTVSAQILTLPIGIYYFGGFSIVAAASNLLVIPIVSALMSLSLLSVLLHISAGILPLFYTADRGLIALVEGLYDLLISVNGFFAEPAWAYRQLELGAAEVAATYLVILAVYLRWEIHKIKENRYEPKKAYRNAFEGE